MNIPEDIVEKAAQAANDRNPLNTRWGHAPDYVKDMYRDDARAALSAAAPHLMATALREAADDYASETDPDGYLSVMARNLLRHRANELEQK